jgi:NAD(P) transhydrogenase subunit alpha
MMYQSLGKRRSIFCLLTLLGCLVSQSGCDSLNPPPVETHDESALAVTDVDQIPETKDGELPVEVTTVPAGQAALSRNEALLAGLTIFVLSIFVGFELITKVPPTLHTPLMSGSNAISGITLVGAVLMAGGSGSRWAMFFGFLAVILAAINAVGGFLVTDRMLSMFKKK